jgi:O-antigen/teichoic acid export membrane protein
LFTNTFIYGASGSFVALIPLFLLPFMARALTQDEYGLVLFFIAVVALLLPVVGFGSSNALSVRYFQLEVRSFSSYLSSCLFVLFVSIVFLIVAITAFSPIISIFSSIPFIWAFVAVLTASFWGVSNACSTLLIAKQSPYKYLFIKATIGLVTIIISLILIGYFDLSWHGFALSLFGAHLIACLISLYILSTESKFGEIKKESCIDSLKFGVPIMVHSISITTISYFDRIVISNYLDLSELAKYGVAFQIGIILSFVAQSFNKAFTPWLYSNLKKDTTNSKIKVVQGTYVVFIIIILTTFIYCIIIDFIIIKLAGEEYYGIENISKIIAIGGAFNAGYLMIIGYVFYAGKTMILGVTTVSVSCFFIILTYFMVPRFGIEGAAISFAVANFLLFISVWILASTCFSMPWFSKEVFRLSEKL